jgi:hypothetical protein
MGSVSQDIGNFVIGICKSGLRGAYESVKVSKKHLNSLCVYKIIFIQIGSTLDLPPLVVPVSKLVPTHQALATRQGLAGSINNVLTPILCNHLLISIAVNSLPLSDLM